MMAKRKSSERASKTRAKKARRWTDRLDSSAIEEALEEACIDAYHEQEQHTGLLTLIEDELQFPFHAEAIGEEVEVVDMQWPRDDPFGLDLVVERGGRRHRIEARNVELLDPLPKGHQYLAAYLEWKRRL